MKPQSTFLQEIEKEGSLKNHFQKQQETYASDINLAIYMDLSDVEKLHIFDIVQVNDRQDILVNFYGFRMGLSDQMNQKLYELFIRQMDPLLRNESKRNYFVIVFDSLSDCKDCFSDFRDIYKRLPALYFAKLNKIFHVQPGFLTRTLALIHFTSWSKVFYRHIEYVYQVQNLQEIGELKIFNILANCPKQIAKQIKVIQQTPQIVNQAFAGPFKPKPFGQLKRQLKDYEMDSTRGVPLLLSILIETIKEKRQICFLEGIFRIAASIEDEEGLLKQIKDFKTFRILDEEKYCKRAVAGLMKKIFTESLTPLIPYQVYNFILNENIDQANILNVWKATYREIPKLNKRILCYVTKFLHQFILQNKEVNKMNAHNLAVVFNPCFFRAKQSTLADLMNSGKFAAFFKWWLQNYDQIISGTESQSREQIEKGNSIPQRHRKNIQKINFQGGRGRQIQQF